MNEDGNLPGASLPEEEFASLQAEFAIRGHILHHSRRADDGRITYVSTRWGQAKCLSELGDVRAFLAQIGGCS